MDQDLQRSGDRPNGSGPARMAAGSTTNPTSAMPVPDTAAEATATVDDTANPVIDFVQKNPLLAVAAALVIGAGVAAAVTPRRRRHSADSAHHDLKRYGRRMQRTVNRELRASGAADTVSQIAAALPAVDLKQIVDRMTEFAASAVESARKRMNVG